MEQIDQVVINYQKKDWKIYFREIHDDPPVETISTSVYISEAQQTKELAKQGKLPEEFIFLDLELLAAELQHPEQTSFYHCQGGSKFARLKKDWNGHTKGKLALAVFAPDEISGLQTVTKVCHLWLIEV
jgi:hypothetical protein